MSRTLLRLKRESGISPKTLLQKKASSHVERRIFWFYSSCGRKLGVSLELQQGNQEPACIASGNSSLHVSCEELLRIPLQSVPGSRFSSGIEAGTSGFLSSADVDLGVPREIQQVSQTRLLRRHAILHSSRAIRVVSGFLSS